MALTKEEQKEFEELTAQKAAYDEAVAAAAPQTNDRLTGNDPTIGSRVMDAMRNIRGSAPVEAILGRSGSTPSEHVIDSNGLAGRLVDSGLEAGAASGGQALGVLTGPLAPIAVPTLGAIGGGAGNFLGQLRDGNGISPGRIAAAAATGAIPGASLAKAGLAGVAKEGLKYGLGNVVGKALETGIDQQRMPTGAEAGLALAGGFAGAGAAKLLDKGLNKLAVNEAIRRSEGNPFKETLEAGRKLGLVIPPNMSRKTTNGGGALNDTLNAIGGKASMSQAAIEANQPLVNKAVREELGLKPGTQLGPSELDLLKRPQAKVYEVAAAVSPEAKVALDQYKKLSSDAKNLFAQNRQKYDANTLAAARDAQDQAEGYWGKLSDQLEGQKMPGSNQPLIKDLQKARTEMAKIETVRDALKVGSGDIDPVVLGNLFEDGAKLTGKLETIGRFQSTFSRAMKAQSDSPPSGTTQLLPMVATGLGLATGSTSGPANGLAAAGAVMATPYLARLAALSRPYQKAFVNPAYGATRQDIPAALARFTSQSASRQIDPSQYLKR